MNWLKAQFDLEHENGELDETRYGELMNNLTPDNFCEFLQEIGLTANDSMRFLARTLARVEMRSDKFDT